MLEELAESREWLRMHGDYNINVQLWGLYGCYTVEGKYLNTVLFISNGMTLSRSLKKVLTRLKLHASDLHAR